jgi:hypothetical protein
MTNPSESYKRFEAQATVTVLLALIVSVTVLAGLCMVQPSGPPEPCTDKLYGPVSTVIECAHEDHKLVKSPDGYLCQCGAGETE